MDHFETGYPDLEPACAVAADQCLQLKADETVLIISNPETEVVEIAHGMYNAALDCEARPTLIIQPKKSQFDFAEPAVVSALSSRPDAAILLSSENLGRDRQGLAQPYSAEGRNYDGLFSYLLWGEKTLRAFWSSGITREIFTQTVPIDYSLLQERCRVLKPQLDRAVRAQVRAPGGTDLVLGLDGRRARVDDGDFGRPGQGGNLPTGEVFISPQLETAEGLIVFDACISMATNALVLETPIRVKVAGGFISSIEGGAEADQLKSDIEAARNSALIGEKEKTLPPGQGEVYARNAGSIGELGIGLNPLATIQGNSLVDEKVLGTCHLAVGYNYDGDAPALIHLDGVIHRPSIDLFDADGNKVSVLKEGLL